MSSASKSNIAVSFVTALLVALALTTVFKARHVLVWKLNILATEFGHWLFLISVMLALAAFFLSHANGGKSIFLSGTLIVCALLFARPVAQAYMGENVWASYFERSFGVSAPSSMMSFGQLWIGDHEKPVVAEHY